MEIATSLASRLHHTAFAVRDLAITRHFYEDLIGLPLIATYCEVEELLGAEREYCHCFFGLAEGGALAFFQFANACDVDTFVQATPTSPFYHVAIKCEKVARDAISARLAAAGYDRGLMEVDHGYCASFYITDPDGMALELTVDSDAIDPTAPTFANAREELERWLGGDRSPNNALRPEHSSAS